MSGANIGQVGHWFGHAAKGGGTLGPVGFETLEGFIDNLKIPTHRHSFNLSSLRLGIGLGASLGGSLIFVFNCMNPQSLHRRNEADWGVNISLGARWGDVAKALKSFKLLSIVDKLRKAGMRVSSQDLEFIRNLASMTYTAAALTDQDKDKVVIFDLPLIGLGLEASLHKTYGTIYIGPLTIMKPASSPLTA